MHKALAIFSFIGPLPKGKFMAQIKIGSDVEEHPYGQWSASVIMLPYFVGHGVITLLSSEAPPFDEGQSYELYRGVNKIGEAIIFKIYS